MIPARLFQPNAPALEWLWQKFDANRDLFDDSLVGTPIEMACWLAARDTATFTIGADENAPDGVVIFSGIQPGYGAFAHIFLWNPDPYPHSEMVATLKVIALAILKAHDLHRLTLVVPVRKPEARLLATRVGFKAEGTIVEGVKEGGVWSDAWIMGFLARYAQDATEGGTLKPGESEG
jgi:hypothetical protein